MKRTFIVGLSVATLLAFAGTANAQHEKALKLFAANKCGTCHSVAGKGNKKGPLDEVGSKLTAAEIRAWVSDPVVMTKKTKATRKPAMKPLKLSPADVDALVAYLVTLKKK
jgi:mono/diheme cytochrome c family protein